ncbi:hypothetical protein SAMN04488132_11023 [Sediminibacterium ginsengisoli]|uniref:Uncharacterized protein n=2 Tax=Sediminibacterium ginsengisoli TaxID=413434 RepID=A0A1T4QZU6_9BACT|nr:hypothetical protein SAMN04488132_11023 [Sediminibacterium ginsengisoli]
MGSPYRTCEIEILGSDTIKIANGGWQDKYAFSSGNEKLVLIKWDFLKNEPGFRFVLVDVNNGKIQEGSRIEGFVNTLSISGKRISFNKFLFNRRKSVMGEGLCCHTDEVYEFS